MFARSLVKGHRVCVLGAAGGIGQPLSLLLKSNKMITDLSLYDVANVAGVAADLSHICTPAKVKGYAKEELKAALEGMDIVLIPAGVPRKPGMTRDELFATNAGIVRALAEACAEVCPNAHLGIISNPVNSTVPIAAEVYKKKNVFNPRRMYGITTLDILRANTFVAEALNRCPSSVEVNVIGGHSGSTIVPLLSQCAGTDALSKETIERITYRVQFGGDEVVKAKNGAGSATLSMAMAASRFTTTLLRALHGEPNQKECTYVFSEVESRVPFFSSVVTFNKDGVASIGSIGTINEYEKALLEKCIPDLQANIEKGIAFAKAA